MPGPMWRCDRCDIDILVPQDQVLAAYELLLANGYFRPAGSKLDLADPRVRAQTRQLARYRRWLES